MIIKIIIRVLALAIIIAVLNYVYKYTFYNKDLAEKSEQIITLKETQKETDIYYFGESSNFNTSENDSTRQSISALTNLFFPSLRITAINQAGTHAGIYKHWLTQIDTRLNVPKALVITLNVRSFNAPWINSSLEPALQSSVILADQYPSIVNRFLLSLNNFDNKTPQQRERAIASEWKNKKLKLPFAFTHQTVDQWDKHTAQGLQCNNVDSDKVVLACHYIKTYAFNIDENNPRIKDFDQIANWCKKNNIPLYFNLLAENIDYADSLVGKELVFLMKQNRDYLVRRYNQNNCKVVDNFEWVKGLEFTDQNWTTEHYSYKGRMIIAKNLANSLKTQFNNYYKPAY